jgi:hypothetical protein
LWIDIEAESGWRNGIGWRYGYKIQASISKPELVKRIRVESVIPIADELLGVAFLAVAKSWQCRSGERQIFGIRRVVEECYAPQ